MTARYLQGIVSCQSMERINNYLYVPKNQKFIRNKMEKLANMNHCNPQLWQALVRDSAPVIIQLPEYQLRGFNFAHFVQSFLIRPNNRLAVSYFEEFCIQALANNPLLIENRYYVGNGGSPVFEMMVTYLVNRTINGSPQLKFSEVELPLFRIIKYAVQNNQFINIDMFVRCLYSVYMRTDITVKTQDAICLIFDHFVKLLSKNGPIQVEARLNDYPHIFQTVFRNLFSSYSGKLCFYWSILRFNQQRQNQFNQLVKKAIGDVFVYLSTNHKELLRCYSKEISKALIVVNNLQNIIQLVCLPGFKEVIFSQHFIWDMFSQKKRKWCQFIWSFKEERQRICKIQENGKNILEFVCENRGLTHNLVDMLWESGHFDKMPEIKNKKSKALIQAKYQCS